MQPIPLPAPYGGIDEFSPFFELAQPNCELLFNFNVSQIGCTLRKGDSIVNAHAAPTGETLIEFFSFGSETFVAMLVTAGGNLRIRNAVSGATVYTSAVSVAWEISSINIFSGRLFIFLRSGGIGLGVTYDGTTWGAIGYTGPTYIGAAASYKNRQYVSNATLGTENEYYYSSLSAITGALVGPVSLSGYSSERTVITMIAPFTLAEGVGSKSLLAFILASGEVLFFSGSYPDSPDWQLEGSARIGPAFNSHAKIPYDGDTLILGQSGIVSLRNLFLKGEEGATVATLERRVEKSWKAQIIDVPTGFQPVQSYYARGCWDKIKNKIIVFFPYNYTESNYSSITDGVFFVYDILLQAWVFHQYSGALSGSRVMPPLFVNNVVLFAVSMGATTGFSVLQKEGATGFRDRSADDAIDEAYPFDLISAAITNGRAFVQRCMGMDFIMSSDMYEAVFFSVISDFGRETSAGQAVSVVSTGVAKPFVNIGIEGTFIQYRISGSTPLDKTIGVNFYAANFWQDNGGSPR